MGIWAAWPGRAKAARRAHPHDGASALSCDEQRRFDEIARRIDQDTATTDVEEISPTTAVVPVRLAALGLFVVGVTGFLTGLARNDAIVLAVVGIAPAATAMLLTGLAWAPRPVSRPSACSPYKRFWLWLTTCAENGCGNHPVHLGWCREHAAGHGPGRDEYWDS